MSDQASITPRVDLWSLIGLALLLLPWLTMAHELGGHALACVATGHLPSELGAYYVECPGTGVGSGRIVAMAGTGMDLLLAALGWFAWSRVRRPLPRLVWWVVFTVKGMVAGGYWMFSGVFDLGDWALSGPDGIGPLPWPWLWRVLMFVLGLAVYIAVVRRAIRMLATMLGGGAQAAATQRRIGMTLYLVGGVSALLVSLLNPLGIVITLMSAIASSFGGTAGLFNVAFAGAGERPPADFVIGRHGWLLVAGLVVTLAFAVVLGPTVHLG